MYDTLSKAEAIKADVVIVDTAGRLHNKANLMRELEKINNINVAWMQYDKFCSF